MNVQCRPMSVSDFGVVECAHWEAAEQVRQFIERQGIGSMLAFDGERYLGQLYLQEYDPAFRDPIGWVGHRPWADFQLAEPLHLDGRFLTLGCYHVGWMPDNTRDTSLYGRGIGTSLLKAVIAWFRAQDAIDGLLTWGVMPGSKRLLQMAGQMPYTVYERFGFPVIKKVRDPRWIKSVTREQYPDIVGREPGLLRVMLLEQK